MRILYITEIYPDVNRGLGVWGGGEKQFFEISQATANRGHEVFVLTCQFPGQSKEEPIGCARVIRRGLTRDVRSGGARRAILPIVTYVLRTATEALQNRPETIHCNTYFPVYAGRVAAWILRVPLITTFHDIYRLEDWIIGQNSHFWGLLGHFATIIAARLPQDRIIAVSPQCKRKLIALGVDPGKIAVIPNGVDVHLLDSTRAKKNPYQVLYVGRLVALKNVDRLITAFATVVGKIPRAVLKIVGDGPERPTLEGLVGRLGLGERVVFTGVTSSYDAVARYFKESSIFVLPSVVEGESIATKEAMAAGLPVIGMRIAGSGILSIIRDGENGYLIRPNETKELSSKIMALLTNSKLRKRIGTTARKHVRSLDWTSIADRTFQLYQQTRRRIG